MSVMSLILIHFSLCIKYVLTFTIVISFEQFSNCYKVKLYDIIKISYDLISFRFISP